MKYKFLIGALLLYILSTCHKDNVELCLPISEQCNFGIDSFTINILNNDTTFNFNDCNFGPVEVYPEDRIYEEIAYSPIDSQKIAYIQFTSNPYECNLIVFDFCSGEKLTINRVTCTELDWSKKDWILYRKENFLYKIKSNGDSITQLASSNGIQFVIWNSSGDKLAYKKSTNSDKYFIIADENFNQLDTIEELKYTVEFDWSINDKIAVVMGTSNTDYGIYEYDLNQNTITAIHLVAPFDYIYKVNWSDDENEIFWVSRNGINRTNINGQTTQILDVASNRKYQDIALFFNNESILARRINNKKINNCTVEKIEGLYLININSGTERKCEID